MNLPGNGNEFPGRQKYWALALLTVRMLVSEVLGNLGYTTIEAGDGAAGLHLLQSDARISLLITDVGLPGAMNGRQVADAARATA